MTMASNQIHRGDHSAPATHSQVVTPHATNEVSTTMPRYLYVGVSGDVTMQLYGDTTSVLFKTMPSGLYKMSPRVIAVTGTTATNMVVLW
jgi:hypothetical protein